jgi:hypothetical protein
LALQLETKFKDSIYIESSQINEILISYTDTVKIGDLVSITGKKVIKTGGLELLSNLTVGQAIKINKEVKRVDYIEDDNTFYVTREFTDTHALNDGIFKDFSNNDVTTSLSVGTVYKLDKDSFENQVAISDLVGGILAINRCTLMNSASSLFIFDDAENPSEREESFITGTYNIDNEDVSNLRNPFLAKIGRQLYFILDMVEDVESLNGDGEVEIVGLNTNIYSIKINGVTINNLDFLISGNVITITNTDLLRGNFDYIEVLHFPNQTNYLSNNSITIKLGIYNYDKLFMFNDEDLDELNYMCLRTDFTSQVAYEFYDVNNRSTKQKERIKTGVNSTISITNRIAEGSDDDKLIQRHLQYYIDNLDKFRIIRKVAGLGTYEYHNSARLIDGSSFTEGHPNTYTYTVDFLQRVIISPNNWGDKKWGDFYWGVEKTALE